MTTLRSTAKRTLEQADDMADSVINKAGRAKNRMVAAADDALDDGASNIRNMAEQAGAYVGEAFNTSRATAQQVAGDMENRVRSNPLASLAAAFVGGLVVAGLLNRR